MAELKTQPTDKSVLDYLNTIENEVKKTDSFAILELMRDITGEDPVMWGNSIIGFGIYHYHYASGRNADWFLTGFAPRKQSLTLYIMSGFTAYEQLLTDLGKHKTGKSCLYINKLDNIDMDVLHDLVKQSVDHMIETNK